MSDLWTLMRIGEIQREAETANLLANIANATTADLAQVMRRQQMTIRDLGVALTVLSQMLIDAGVVEQRGAAREDRRGDHGAGSGPQPRAMPRVPTAEADGADGHHGRRSGPLCYSCAAKRR